MHSVEFDSSDFFLLNFSCEFIHCIASGVLEANFIEPAHDKQDFERSSLFIRLEKRLKEMVMEYWYSLSYPTEQVKMLRAIYSRRLTVFNDKLSLIHHVPLSSP